MSTPTTKGAQPTMGGLDEYTKAYIIGLDEAGRSKEEIVRCSGVTEATVDSVLEWWAKQYVDPKTNSSSDYFPLVTPILSVPDIPLSELVSDAFCDPNLCFRGVFSTYGYKENIMLPRNRALTPLQADEPCNGHTPESLLKRLNDLTRYHLDMSEPNAEAGLHILITGNHDVGKAYAWFRTAFAFTPCGQRLESLFSSYRTARRLNWIAWYSGLPDISNCESSLTSVDQPGVDAVDKRETVIQDIDGERSIINPDLYHPRRLWDILANRVVPYEWHARTTRMFSLNFDFDSSITILGADRPRSEHTFHEQYANRLADWEQVAFECCVPYAAISHSWAANLKYVLSPVNNQMWPIPLPADTALESVRQDLLDFRLPQGRSHRWQFWEVYAPPHGVEYCWLDILCLRQAWANSKSSGVPLTETAPPSWKELEEIRLKEWEIDVPTIGSIYHRSSDILLYLNGIGRPVSLVREDWESPYHWINRAWTLQEFSKLQPSGSGLFFDDKYGIVMHMDKSPMVWSRGNRSMAALESCLPFRDTYDIASRLPDLSARDNGSIIRLIDTIARRHASNETDKIAGLLFIIGRGGALPHFPIYKPDEDIESAWLRLVNTLYNSWRWSLSIYCPQSPDQLFPTWHSLRACLLNPRQLRNSGSALTSNWGIPGSFASCSSTPLENAHPLVGLQPLACRLLTIETSRFSVERELQILPDEARGIKQDFSFQSVHWYLSPKVRPNSDEIYYLIPYVSSTPRVYYKHSCSDWTNLLAEKIAYFLVCEPLWDENSGRDSWDGITFKKLGCTWFQPSNSRENWNERLFYKLFDSAYPKNLIPLVKDIVRMTPKAAKEKYGKEKVYTLIY